MSQSQATDTFPRYWVREGRLMAGAYPGSPDPAAAGEKLSELLGEGVRAFVDLTEPGEVTRLGLLVPHDDVLREKAESEGVDVTVLRASVPDLSAPTRDGMREILDHLDEISAAGRTAYVHCLGGMGRTGTVVACHLLRHAGELLETEDPSLAREQALARVVALRVEQSVPQPENSPQTLEQFAFVHAWGVGE